MSTLADLTTALNSVNFVDDHARNYHLLRIEYPILDLLPTDVRVTPFLHSPLHAAFRDEPDPNQNNFPLFGTEFVLRVQLTAAERAPSGFNDIFAVLANRLAEPDRTVVQVATFRDTVGGGVYYRFRVLNLWSAGSRIVAEAEMSEGEWLAQYSAHRDIWMSLIWSLLYRTTDRAYLHVDERLKRQRWYKRQVELENVLWDTQGDFEPRVFITAKLRVVVGRPTDRRYNEALRGDHFEEFEERTFLLPCGHKQVLSGGELGSMSASECLHLRCEICGLRVAERHDGWRSALKQFRERERREQFAEREMLWERLHIGASSMAGSGAHRITFNSGLLCAALGHALKSVTPPESVIPAVLNPVKDFYFAEVLRVFETMLEGDGVITLPLSEIVNTLYDTLNRAISQTEEASGSRLLGTTDLPDSWADVVELWFSRVEQLFGIPNYGGESITEVYGEESMTYDEVEGDGDDKELEAMMDDAWLEE